MTISIRSARALCSAAVSAAISLTVAGAAAQAQGVVPQGGRRLALVVGNDTYPASPLQNARNDARSMAATLRELGFTVMVLEDATRNQMVARVAEMSETLRPEDVAFFFYSGHGLQLDGENYLVPSDFEGTSVTAVRLTTLPVGEIQAALSRAKVSVMVLDACRNNPFAATRSGGSGLAPMEARGNIIAFATGAGQTASDNPADRNGLFTQHLLATLREPNLPLREVFYRTRQRVYEASNGRQFPAVYDGLLGEIVLRPGTGTVATAPQFAAGAAPPAPAAATPAVAASAGAAPAADGGVRFELLHYRTVERVIVTSVYMDSGVLTVSPGRVRWSENGDVLSADGPNKAKSTRGDRDDFDATCADIDRVSKIRNVQKVDRWYGDIKVGGRNYSLYAIELDKGKLAYKLPRPDVLDAIKKACPDVTVK
jgi:uncharacterized caspase-like protein